MTTIPYVSPYDSSLPNEGFLQCCEDMMAAQQRETDNEGYGRLVQLIAHIGHTDYRRPVIGTDLPPILFCPWCGAPVKVIR